MASSTKIDLIEGAQVTERNGAVVEAVRIAHVSGLTAGTSTMADALSAPGMPLPAAVHPNIPGVFVNERTVDSIGMASTQARVKIVYRSPEAAGTPPEPQPIEGEWLISGGTGLVSRRTNRDRLGTLITVSYTPVLAPGEMGPPAPIVQAGEVDVPLPQSTLVFQSIVVTTTPGVLTKTYGGKVNSLTWQGGAPGTWLCTDATFTSRELPNKWLMRFEFQFNEDTHKFEVWWIDPETGRAPSDVIAGTGTKFIEEYDPVNFSPFFPT